MQCNAMVCYGMLCFVVFCCVMFCSVVLCYVPTFLRSYVGSFVRSYVRTFVRSFVRSYVCIYLAVCLSAWRMPVPSSLEVGFALLMPVTFVAGPMALRLLHGAAWLGWTAPILSFDDMTTSSNIGWGRICEVRTYAYIYTYLTILNIHPPTYPCTFISLYAIWECLANLFKSSKYLFDTLKSNTAPSITEQPVWHIWLSSSPTASPPHNKSPSNK